MFRLLRNLMGGRTRDDRIKELVNEVSQELGIHGKPKEMSPREADQLGEEVKREIRKRT